MILSISSNVTLILDLSSLEYKLSNLLFTIDNKLLESFVCVKVEGRMYGKMHLVGGLLHNHFEELKMALSTSTDEVKLEFKKSYQLLNLRIC